MRPPADCDCEELIEVEGHDKLKKIERGVFIGCRRLRRLTKNEWRQRADTL
jgi:hypothetical protein